MSTNEKITTTVIQQRKIEGKAITMLTAYDFSTAKFLDDAQIDMLLVGDSLGNVILGYDSTLPVTMEDMIHHGKAVCRGAKKAMVVVDMPFMSYQVSAEQAVANAGRIMKETGAQAVKLEGGSEIAEAVKKIVTAGIPVVGHLGLTPQSVHSLGGFKVQGKEEIGAQKLLNDAKILEENGAFAVVLECVPALLAQKVTQQLNIPTIGIGAGVHCDGQVLVINDLLGLYPGFTPKFVKQYAVLHAAIAQAVADYKKEVTEKKFPAAEHSFKISDGILEKLY
ncbi:MULTISPECIES: 3-methyl-2-oxobutanoate hydroxymethyltransferase [Pelosinus]|uniref:3-methyl-2-oxobutanoate hydroxymethyltransferase n=1 Tax=Pelosinus fermentans B4 TaxID=1149862 RepID=I8RHE7_9FIRM|nr:MULTISPECIES: 3-methyl-2-oxobutanoate hydroxymethyltransferase [Pelosinus]EIW19173.1 3-methyl-2-oxobutanoate hydroxymethyltransferase [Pelosinus fermentans B4]EIW25095.1 3-methyl-2-oxobutanoate hydroxymethyltransferase [Pelosinus fermentans A11]OAM96154.1 3-methyl-2-oxobutanoate hydroxymethyltransferase [Pelosinus fermentans DSM 17108]SDR36939.1 ketopantoate hydroxymethyltransferase [Pelosinus fermentans]